jgi:membrane protease YdiL (CAAX protease family)
VRRIPNLGHAVVFLIFAAMLFLLLQLALAMLGFTPVARNAGQITVPHPMLQIAVLGATYAGTLAAAWLFFPLAWHRPFLEGVHWNWAAARPLAWQLPLFGLLLGLTMAIVTYFITPPKQLPIDQFFTAPLAAWGVTFFGICVAPVFEEIAFRGMLLPAFAIAFDWLRMPRTAEGYAEWRTSSTLSASAWVFSAIITSALFAAIHAQQVAHLWAVLAALFCVSLILTWVRVKMQSVAASTMVHAAYNGFIFLVTILQTDGYRHLERLTR